MPRWSGFRVCSVGRLYPALRHGITVVNIYVKCLGFNIRHGRVIYLKVGPIGIGG